MKNTLYKLYGIQINHELYYKERYYWLHRLQVTSGVASLLFLFIALGQIWHFFEFIAAIIVILLLLLIWTRKFKIFFENKDEGDLDHLYTWRFYKMTGAISIILFFVLIVLKGFWIDLVYKKMQNEPFFEIFVLFFMAPLVVVIVNSIYMLKSKPWK